VLPIGGVKEKVLAAMRAGITTVMPKRNEKDLRDVPEEARQKMQFVLLETVDDAVSQRWRSGRQPGTRRCWRTEAPLLKTCSRRSFDSGRPRPDPFVLSVGRAASGVEDQDKLRGISRGAAVRRRSIIVAKSPCLLRKGGEWVGGVRGSDDRISATPEHSNSARPLVQPLWSLSSETDTVTGVPAGTAWRTYKSTVGGENGRAAQSRRIGIPPPADAGQDFGGPDQGLINQRDLALAYSPGVAYACKAIEANPALAAELHLCAPIWSA
jgi:hypothetical protein